MTHSGKLSLTLHWAGQISRNVIRTRLRTSMLSNLSKTYPSKHIPCTWKCIPVFCFYSVPGNVLHLWRFGSVQLFQNLVGAVKILKARRRRANCHLILGNVLSRSQGLGSGPIKHFFKLIISGLLSMILILHQLSHRCHAVGSSRFASRH